MVNGHVAAAFDELALLLELEGESSFKVRAYRNFADLARTLVEPLTEIDRRGELDKLSGVGEAIASKVRELLKDGRMDRLERARANVPAGLKDLVRIPGLGPAKARKLWQQANVTTIRELVEACKDGRIAKLAGFGGKSQSKLLADAEAALLTVGHVLLAQAHAIASTIIASSSAAGATHVRTAGAVRRAHELVDALVLVVADRSPAEVANALADPSSGARVIETGADEVIAIPSNADAPRIRIRCATSKHFVEALIVETGDDAHVAALSARAQKKGTTLSAICADLADEEAAYRALDLAFVPPELREGGLVEPPPDLLPVRGVRGIFHVHTTWSDGTASIVDMARAAVEAGYAYIGISDHSRAASYAHGLDVDRLVEQRAAIEKARAEVPQIRILHGIEVDVMDDGTLDLPNDALAKLDFVVASLHMSFQLGHEAQTQRIVRALGHPLVTILGHPTGRLLLGRPGYTFELDEVARAAAKGGVALEINASPQRLDLAPPMIKRAAELGARFCINPDAHDPREVANVPLGIAQARRAALRNEQVINTADVDEMISSLRARREKGARALGVAIES
jgi:DNA polymerase (family 10)